ncbi:MAG: hypothetical protein M0R40_08960 [Firmicutes bacterium]|nr:hypothetical protein [Bacillota bacterium]
MKRIIFFIPFIIFALLILFIYSVGSIKVTAPALIILLCFAISGVLLSKNKAWGSIFSLAAAGMIIYEGTTNWKLGREEIMIGVFIALFYIALSIYVFVKNRNNS